MRCSLMDLNRRRFQFAGHLEIVKVRISAVAGQKLVVLAFLDDPSSLKDDDAVSKPHCGKTMGDNNGAPCRGGTAGRVLLQVA